MIKLLFLWYWLFNFYFHSGVLLSVCFRMCVLCQRVRESESFSLHQNNIVLKVLKVIAIIHKVFCSIWYVVCRHKNGFIIHKWELTIISIYDFNGVKWSFYISSCFIYCIIWWFCRCGTIDQFIFELETLFYLNWMFLCNVNYGTYLFYSHDFYNIS